MPSIGETAPDFEMLDDTGNRVKLSDFRGMKVVLSTQKGTEHSCIIPNTCRIKRQLAEALLIPERIPFEFKLSVTLLEVFPLSV